MAQNHFYSSLSDDPAMQGNICTRCGKTADMHLSLLRGSFHGSSSFCFSCGEGLIHELKKQQLASPGSEPSSDLLSAFANPGVHQKKAFLHSDASYDEIEGGIIFWEGHGWSSDGPFAGA